MHLIAFYLPVVDQFFVVVVPAVAQSFPIFFHVGVGEVVYTCVESRILSWISHDSVRTRVFDVVTVGKSLTVPESFILRVPLEQNVILNL